RAVRVVLDRRDLRGDTVLHALEVDDPVAALVAAAPVACRSPAVDVAAARLLQGRGQALLGLLLRDLLEGGDGHEPPARARRLVAADRHDLNLRSLEDLDRLALAQLDDGLLPARPAALPHSAPLRLRGHRGDVH